MSEPGSLIRSLSGRPTARNFHSYVIGEVGVGIASGKYPVGSVLPNDAEMMDRYGVSRTVLREALKTLEAKGLVEARAKVGTRVLPRNRWNLFDRQVLTWIFEAGPDKTLLSSLVDLRQPLELQAAALAARHRTAEHIRMLHYWLNQRLVTARMAEPHSLAEFELHRVVFEASQSPFLRAASGVVEFALAAAISARRTAGVEDFAEAKAQLYERLVTAVEAGNSEGAEEAMGKILLVDRPWILGAPPR